jgi:hypothetical protein
MKKRGLKTVEFKWLISIKAKWPESYDRTIYGWRKIVHQRALDRKRMRENI